MWNPWWMMVVMLHAYVDETGDRGTSVKASPYFAMAAVVVPDTHRVNLTRAVAEIKEQFGIPVRTPVHWNRHCKDFARRRFVADKLASVDGVQLNYVIFEKAAIPSKAAIMTDHVMFYNYTAGITLERILLTAAGFPGHDKRVQVQFGHVKGFDHGTTDGHFWGKRKNTNLIDWSLLAGDPTFVNMDRNSGLQAADLYAGILAAAICPDAYGGYEEAHLLKIAHQMRRNPATGRTWGYGFKVMARDDFITRLPWWSGNK